MSGSKSHLRRKMLELKEIHRLTYRELGERVGVAPAILLGFGNQTGDISEITEKALRDWIFKNGGGYVFFDGADQMVH